VLARRGAGETVIQSDLELRKPELERPITRSEFPVTIHLAVARGNETQQYLNKTSREGRMRGAPRVNNALLGQAPAWFVRMDTNGDGDLTRREFLGDDDQFKRLDTNPDGVISVGEVLAVDGKKEE
jgi:hypothetical protein